MSFPQRITSSSSIQGVKKKENDGKAKLLIRLLVKKRKFNESKWVESRQVEYSKVSNIIKSWESIYQIVYYQYTNSGIFHQSQN